MQYQLIRLTAEWVSAYRDIRLESLKDRPQSFASSYERESAWPVKTYASRLTNSYTMGVVVDGALAAIATLIPSEHAVMPHKATIVAVYVRPAYRGNGYARMLMEALIAEAAQHYEQIIISVEAENTPAIHVYKSLGFEQYGFEPRAAKIGDTYYDDLWMVKFLK